MHHPTDRITHNTAFVTPVVEHWLERKIAQWVREPLYIDLPNSFLYVDTLLNTFSVRHKQTVQQRMTFWILNGLTYSKQTQLDKQTETEGRFETHSETS